VTRARLVHVLARLGETERAEQVLAELGERDRDGLLAPSAQRR
jgi:predicted acyltransferase (DUF342 family)